MSERHGVIVGISGASGAAIGARIVERLAGNPGCAVHLVVSSAAERTLAEEVGADAPKRLRALAFRHHSHSDIGACIASGSFPVSGMIVAPCSIRTLSAIAWGQLDNLLVRAADVQLKERRRLVLLVPLLLAVSLVTFILIRLVPGDPVTAQYGLDPSRAKASGRTPEPPGQLAPKQNEFQSVSDNLPPRPTPA